MKDGYPAHSDLITLREKLARAQKLPLVEAEKVRGEIEHEAIGWLSPLIAAALSREVLDARATELERTAELVQGMGEVALKQQEQIERLVKVLENICLKAEQKNTNAIMRIGSGGDDERALLVAVREGRVVLASGLLKKEAEELGQA